MYFHIYFKIGDFFQFHQFWRKTCFGYFKSQISKCPSIREILHHVLAYRMHFSLSNEHIFLPHSKCSPCSSDKWPKLDTKHQYKFQTHSPFKHKPSLGFWRYTVLLKGFLPPQSYMLTLLFFKAILVPGEGKGLTPILYCWYTLSPNLNWVVCVVCRSSCLLSIYYIGLC